MTDTGRRPALTVALPLMRKAISYEAGMWRSLFRWISRRPLTSGTGAQVFGYSALTTPILWAFVGLNVVEVAVVHLLLPWHTARNIVDALGVYGTIWMLGLVASVRVHPHVINDFGLRIRSGMTVDLAIPWDAIATIRIRDRTVPKSLTIQSDETGSGHVLNIAVMSRTNVDVAFRQPTTLPLPKGRSEPVTELHFYVDDPSALVAGAQEHLTADLPSRDK